MDMDIFMDIYGISVDMDMDGKFHSLPTVSLHKSNRSC